MAQQINVPGVGILQFPDGMSDADMATAIQKNFPQIHGKTDYGNPAESGTESYLDIPSMSIKQRPSSPFVAGVGKAFVDTGRGIKQLVDKGLDLVSPKSQTLSGQIIGQSRAQADEADIASSRQLDQPLMATTGGKVGQMTGQGAMLAAAPEGLLGAVGGGAALAGAQPTSGDESRLANTAVGAAGGAAGYGVGKAIGKVIQPITDSLSTAGRWARSVLQREDVPLDAAQATGSKVVQTLKNAAGDAPTVGNSPFPEAQKAAFTQAALRQMGVGGATDASPSVMQAGKRALQNNYNAVASRTNVQLDNEFAQDWDRIRQDAQSSLTPENAQVVHNKLDDILTMMERNGSTLSGQAYQKAQSSLGQMAKDGGKAPFVTDIRQALTGMMERQATPDDVALLQKTNQQYGAMKVIQKAIDDDNLVSPAKLYNAMDTAKGANQTVYGQGPNQRLSDLAQAGKLLISNTRTPNSGTAQRVAGMAALGGSVDYLTHVAMGDAHTSPEEFLAAAAAAGLSGKAAQQLVYSQGGRQWLQKWAQSRVAAMAARGANKASQVAGGVVGTQISQSQ